MLLKESNQKLADLKNRFMKLQAVQEELRIHHTQFQLEIGREIRWENNKIKELKQEIEKRGGYKPRKVSTSAQIVEQIWSVMNNYRQMLSEKT